MLSQGQFEQLLESPESSILDFKREMYHFDSDSDKRKISAFIKDVIAFGNTIRTGTAYIIIGVEENNEKSKKLIGIDNVIDDATLQEKVKSKIHPRPEFSFYTIKYNDLNFGVFEFPVTKYITPLMPTEKLRGLEVGKIYMRKGTSNTEALGIEIIHISDWLRSLPEISNSLNLNDEISAILTRLTTGNEKLSIVISELYSIAKKYDLGEIQDYCKAELLGLQDSEYNLDSESFEKNYDYRVQLVYETHLKVTISPYFANTNKIKAEMEENDDFRKSRFMITYSITSIESSLDQMNEEGKNHFITETFDFKQVYPDSAIDGDFKLYFYMFDSNYHHLYKNIRQKFIELLVSL